MARPTRRFRPSYDLRTRIRHPLPGSAVPMQMWVCRSLPSLKPTAHALSAEAARKLRYQAAARWTRSRPADHYAGRPDLMDLDAPYPSLHRSARRTELACCCHLETQSLAAFLTLGDAQGCGATEAPVRGPRGNLVPLPRVGDALLRSLFRETAAQAVSPRRDCHSNGSFRSERYAVVGSKKLY
jgi:hypothetical protein